jgi:hypothetical protein
VSGKWDSQLCFPHGLHQHEAVDERYRLARRWFAENGGAQEPAWSEYISPDATAECAASEDPVAQKERRNGNEKASPLCLSRTISTKSMALSGCRLTCSQMAIEMLRSPEESAAPVARVVLDWNLDASTNTNKSVPCGPGREA